MLGGIKLTKVVGAVPVMDVAGDEVAVPPEILELTPAPLLPSSDQVVTNVSTVPPALSATVVRMNSGVYGAEALLSWNMVVAAAPGVRL